MCGPASIANPRKMKLALSLLQTQKMHLKKTVDTAGFAMP